MLAGNELKKLKTFDSSYFIGKSHFEEDGTQNYLVFQPLNKYFKVITNANTKYISSWQSKGLSDESIKPPATSDYKLNPKVNYYGTKTRLEFRGSCLKQDKIVFDHRKVVNIYIVYELIKYLKKKLTKKKELIKKDKIYIKTRPMLRPALELDLVEFMFIQLVMDLAEM